MDVVDIRTLPPFVLAGFAALALMGLNTANPLLTAASVISLPLIIVLTWRPGEPPALAFVMVFHWLQTTVKVFYADILGVSVTEVVMFEMLSQYADSVTSTWLTLAGTIVVAVGMRLAIRSLPRPDREALAERARTFSIPRVFWVYLALSIGLSTAYESIGYWSGLRQMLLAAVQLKWVLYFVLAYVTFVRRQHYLYLATAFAIEFISGIGFFSGFKEVLFVTVISYFTARSQVTLRTFAQGLIVGIVLLIVGSAWTVVKPDYRRLIGEEDRQGAVVGQQEQIETLVSLVGQLDGASLAEGMAPLVDRLSYVDFFGYTIGFVPAIVPHEDGALWGAAFKHIFTPRIFFPDKPSIVSDSEITNRYTGLQVAGESEGSSFSIGYMAESYVDYGPFWMFIPIFLSGVLRGLMFRFFARNEEIRLFAYGFAVALFINWYTLEVATGKLLGGLLTLFIILSLLFRFAGPALARWLSTDPTHERMEEPSVAAPPSWSSV